ncbi:MAG: hypothetical protein K0Q50_3127 [Vampirovibrio sp.]|jgi:hypothetical protein|nr:hypothetical protein [Vampirovibrio sp.]
MLDHRCHREIFQKQGQVLVQGFIPKDVARFLFEYLRFSTHAHLLSGQLGGGDDTQVPGSFGARYGDMVFDVLLKLCRQKMEAITGLDLYPTYTYCRLYKQGNILHRHTDKPQSEFGVSIKLSDTGDYNWPLWVAGNGYALEDGDAVIYRGSELEHWRDVCEGSEEYRMGQVFLFYVHQHGHYADYRYDKREDLEIICNREI